MDIKKCPEDNALCLYYKRGNKCVHPNPKIDSFREEDEDTGDTYPVDYCDSFERDKKINL